MRRVLAPLLLLLPLGLLGATPAAAATVTCTYGEYFPGSGNPDPAVTDLKAHNLPRRTSGYAPRCLVAESVARFVQFDASEGTKPKKVKVMGARWYGGVYRCSYAGTAVTCRKTGKPRRRVTFQLGAG